MKIVELKTFTELQAIYPLVTQLKPGISKSLFTKRLKNMRAQGYRCVAAMDGKKMVGIIGFWTGERFWCGPFIELDNVVVDSSCRSRGIGSKLIRWVEAEAKRLGCENIVLGCYTHSHTAHAFYLRERYIIRGFVFTKDMKG